MQDAVIVDAVRTPFGKRGGSLSGIHAVDLSAVPLSALVERTGIDPSVVDDVIWGCALQASEQALNLGRHAVLAAGWPDSVPSTTIDRQCGSSQQAIAFAAAGLVAGHYDVAVAGGSEAMSRIPIGTPNLDADTLGPALRARLGGSKPHQGIGAETIAQRAGLTRTELDEYSLRSHERAARAQDDGIVEPELALVDLPDGSLKADEGVRRGSTLEKLAALKPAFTPDGMITAANSSQISDGAAAVLMTTGAKAAELGLTPLARIHSSVVVGDDPVVMLGGPIPATHKLLARSGGITIDDIGVFEVNEAFASIPLAWAREFGVDEELLNPTGGAIALGHPLGASGARLMTTMVNHMRRNGIRYGLQVMCEGGGLANAMIVELL